MDAWLGERVRDLVRLARVLQKKQEGQIER